jgi:hypothetical protein
MNKRVKVDKAKFDGVLRSLLSKSPEPREQIKTKGRRTSKPLIPSKP